MSARGERVPVRRWVVASLVAAVVLSAAVVAASVSTSNGLGGRWSGTRSVVTVGGATYPVEVVSDGHEEVRVCLVATHRRCLTVALGDLIAGDVRSLAGRLDDDPRLAVIVAPASFRVEAPNAGRVVVGGGIARVFVVATTRRVLCLAYAGQSGHRGVMRLALTAGPGATGTVTSGSRCPV